MGILLYFSILSFLVTLYLRFIFYIHLETMGTFNVVTFFMITNASVTQLQLQ